MFSLIVTIIAIALVAVLALATIYYGGDILVSQKAKANAATLDAQTQQIFAASQAYYLDNNAWPANVAVLSVDGKYLKTSPVPPGSAYAALPPGLLGAAYADGDGTVTGELPELNKPTATYLESNGDLATDFKVSADDATVLRTQLQQLNGRTDANGANLATKALQMMQREVAVQATGKPSLLDYTWPAAAAQNPRTRYLWIPSKVNKETCRAVNVQWRQSILIPDGYSATNGTVQCFGTDSTGYSYFWLSPGADPNQIVLDGQVPAASGDVCANIPGDQAEIPAGMARAGTDCITAVPGRPSTRFLPEGQFLGVTPPGSPLSGQVVITNRDAAPRSYVLSSVSENSLSSWYDVPVEFVVQNGCENVLVPAGGTCALTVTATPSGPSRPRLSVEMYSLDENGGWLNDDEYTWVDALSRAAPVSTHALTMNVGQAAGPFIYGDSRSTVDQVHLWGELPDAQYLEGETVVALFCGDAAASSALNTHWTDDGSWGWAPEIEGWMSVVQTSRGSCLGLYAGWRENRGRATPGSYPFTVDLPGGKYTGTLVVRAPLPSLNELHLGASNVSLATELLADDPNPNAYWVDVHTPWGNRPPAVRLHDGSTGQDFLIIGDGEGGSLRGHPDQLELRSGESWNWSLWLGVLKASPNANITSLKFNWAEQQGKVTEIPVAQVTSDYPVLMGTPVGFPGQPSATPRLKSRVMGALYVQDVHTIYALARDCDNNVIAYPVGPVGHATVEGYAYDRPPTVAKVAPGLGYSLGGGVSFAMTPDARHRSRGTIGADVLQALWDASPVNAGAPRFWLGSTDADGNDAWMARLEEADGPSQFIPWYITDMASLPTLFGESVTVLSAMPTTPCGCTDPYSYTHLETVGVIPHGQTVSLTYVYYGSCGKDQLTCTDGQAEIVGHTDGSCDTPVDGGHTWGSWEPLMAFSLNGCASTESAYCQESGVQTGSVCPQWDFSASGHTYSGCLRRRCDHPTIAASFIPGC